MNVIHYVRGKVWIKRLAGGVNESLPGGFRSVPTYPFRGISAPKIGARTVELYSGSDCRINSSHIPFQIFGMKTVGLTPVSTVE